MLKTTAGLSAFLSTLNYSIYIGSYLHSKSPTRAYMIAYISHLVGRTASKVPMKLQGANIPGGTSPLTPLGALLSDTRTTLRLTGLLPLYVWLKTLLNNSSSAKDPTLHRIALLQCVSYIAFQAIENVYHLAGRNIVGTELVAKRGGVMKWVTWSCRAWFLGINCDLLRLWREAALARERRQNGETVSAKEQEAMDKKWWNDLFVAVSWYPMALHYSKEGGLAGMNQGLVGLSGFLAGLGNFRAAWAATAN